MGGGFIFSMLVFLLMQMLFSSLNLIVFAIATTLGFYQKSKWYLLILVASALIIGSAAYFGRTGIISTPVLAFASTIASFAGFYTGSYFFRRSQRKKQQGT